MSAGGVMGPTPAAPTIGLVLSPDQALATSLGGPIGEAAADGSLGSAIGGLPPAAMALAAGEIAAATARLAEIDVRSLLLAGWRIQRDIVAAAEETAADPDAKRSVPLVTHRVSATHRPTVEVLVDERPLATLHVELRTELTVDGLVATIRGGRLVSVGVGTTEAVASLSVEGRRLASQRAQLDTSAGFPLGSGIQIVAPQPGR